MPEKRVLRGGGGGRPPDGPPDGDPDGSERGEDDFDEEGNQGVRRIRNAIHKLRVGRLLKEANAIKISPLPTATQFRAWRLLERDAVVAASGRDQIAFYVGDGS